MAALSMACHGPHDSVQCPDRYKCYPISENQSDGSRNFQCLCNRTLLRSGESCSETNTLALVSFAFLLLLAFFFAHKGCYVVSFCMKNHYNRQRVSSRHRVPPQVYYAATLTCVCQLVASLVMLLAFAVAFLDLLIGDMKGYHPYGKVFLQESQVLANTITTLAVSTFFLKKAREVGFILRGREYIIVKNVLIVSQIVVLILVLHSRTSSYMGTTTDDAAATSFILCGLLCSAILSTAGAVTQMKLLKQARHAGIATTDAESPEGFTRSSVTSEPAQQTSRFNGLPLKASARRVGKFAQNYGLVMLLVLGSTIGLRHVEKYPNMYGALESHLLFFFQSLGLILLSHFVYSFLFPNVRVRVPDICTSGKPIHQRVQTLLTSFEGRYKRPTLISRQKVYVIADAVGARQALANHLPIRGGADDNSQQSSSLANQQQFVSSRRHQLSSTLIGQRFVSSKIVSSTTGDI
mmetsp:Transcript_17685/g.27878  ORF Transcript_17685/g.27878 Transcript_17685/m.27878 type:complete len:465 (-) Transcript_17685:275-1669(-)